MGKSTSLKRVNLYASLYVSSLRRGGLADLCSTEYDARLSAGERRSLGRARPQRRRVRAFAPLARRRLCTRSRRARTPPEAHGALHDVAPRSFTPGRPSIRRHRLTAAESGAGKCFHTRRLSCLHNWQTISRGVSWIKKKLF